MSTAQHTAGRLKVRHLVAGVDFLETEDGVKLLAKLHEHEASSHADARRLVACWNACVDADTEEIERLSAGHSLPRLVTYLRGRLDRVESVLEAVRDSRDVLLAALAQVNRELGELKDQARVVARCFEDASHIDNAEVLKLRELVEGRS